MESFLSGEVTDNGKKKGIYKAIEEKGKQMGNTSEHTAERITMGRDVKDEGIKKKGHGIDGSK